MLECIALGTLDIIETPFVQRDTSFALLLRRLKKKPIAYRLRRNVWWCSASLPAFTCSHRYICLIMVYFRTLQVCICGEFVCSRLARAKLSHCIQDQRRPVWVSIEKWRSNVCARTWEFWGMIVFVGPWLATRESKVVVRWCLIVCLRLWDNRKVERKK